MTISKKPGGICDIVFSDTSGVSIPSENIDHIRTTNNDFVFVVYDTINKKDFNIKCGPNAVSYQVKYNIKLYPPSEWTSFNDAFYEHTPERELRKEYYYVSVDILDFYVYQNRKMIREGNGLGR